MDKIWANRLIADTKKWSQVPASRKKAVKAELEARVEVGEITEEQLLEIIGE